MSEVVLKPGVKPHKVVETSRPRQVRMAEVAQVPFPEHRSAITGRL